MKKRILTIGGILALALLLGGAAFIGGRLLNGQGLPAGSSGAPGEIEATPAKELPEKTADVIGVFDHRQDNSIFVGTGNVMVAAHTDRSGQVQTSSSYDGPIVEVVVTSQTIIYEDVTAQQFNGPPPEGQQIQQVVEPGSLDEIGQNSMIVVWGTKTGDRIIADVLVYENPASIRK